KAACRPSESAMSRTVPAHHVALVILKLILELPRPRVDGRNVSVFCFGSGAEFGVYVVWLPLLAGLLSFTSSTVIEKSHIPPMINNSSIDVICSYFNLLYQSSISTIAAKQTPRQSPTNFSYSWQ